VFDFAVFNVADSAISVGVVALAFLLWHGAPHDAPAGATAPSLGEGGSSMPNPASQSARGPTSPRVRNPNPRSH
jgi:hypothetical protein